MFASELNKEKRIPKLYILYKLYKKIYQQEKLGFHKITINELNKKTKQKYIKIFNKFLLFSDVLNRFSK